MDTIAAAAHLLVKYQGNHRFEKTCRGKVPHPDEKEAKRAAKANHKRKHKQFDAYQCPFCNAWHIGGRRNDLRRRDAE